MTHALSRILAGLAAFGVLWITPKDGSPMSFVGLVVMAALILWAARD